VADQGAAAGRRQGAAISAAIALGLAGAAASNITLATHDLSDYIPLLTVAVLCLGACIAIFIRCALRGSALFRIVGLVGALLASVQFAYAVERVSSISSGS